MIKSKSYKFAGKFTKGVLAIKSSKEASDIEKSVAKAISEANIKMSTTYANGKAGMLSYTNVDGERNGKWSIEPRSIKVYAPRDPDNPFAEPELLESKTVKVMDMLLYVDLDKEDHSQVQMINLQEDGTLWVRVGTDRRFIDNAEPNGNVSETKGKSANKAGF